MPGIVKTLKDHFGFRPGEGMRDFANELKALTAVEKQELAELAAVELGYTLDVTP